MIHGLEIGGFVATGAGRGSLELGARIDRGLFSELGVSGRPFPERGEIDADHHT